MEGEGNAKILNPLNFELENPKRSNQLLNVYSPPV